MFRRRSRCPRVARRKCRSLPDAETLRLFSQEAESWKLHITGRAGAPAPVPVASGARRFPPGYGPRIRHRRFLQGDSQIGACRSGPPFGASKSYGSAKALHWRAYVQQDRRVDTGFIRRFSTAVSKSWARYCRIVCTYLPLGLKRFQLFSAPDGDLWSYATLRPGTGSALTGDIRIFNSRGDAVAVAEGMWLRKSTPSQSQSRLCQIEWQSRPRNSLVKQVRGGAWLIFSDAGGIGAGIAGALEADGAACTLVRRGEPFEPILADPPLRGIVHLWALDSPPTEQLTGSTLRHEEQALCGSVLQLIRNLAAKEYGTAAPLDCHPGSADGRRRPAACGSGPGAPMGPRPHSPPRAPRFALRHYRPRPG